MDDLQNKVKSQIKCNNCAAVIPIGTLCNICYTDNAQIQNVTEDEIKPRPSVFVIIVMVLSILFNGVIAIIGAMAFNHILDQRGFTLDPLLIILFILITFSVFTIIVCINMLRKKHWAVCIFLATVVIRIVVDVLLLIFGIIGWNAIVIYIFIILFMRAVFFLRMFYRDWSDYS